MSKIQRKNNKRPQKRPAAPFLKPVTQYPKTTVQPVSKIEDVVFAESVTIFNNPGGPIVSDVYLLNDGYDFKPTILTPTVQFLNYMFTLYAKAKVLWVDLDIEFGNLEQNPVDLYFFASPNNIVGSIASKVNLQNASATGICVWHEVMSEQYGKNSTVLMKKRILPSKCLGNKLEYNGSDAYSFTASSAAPILIYGAWFAATPNSILPTGITVKLTATLHTLFYDMKVINFPALSSRPIRSIPPVLEKEKEKDQAHLLEYLESLGFVRGNSKISSVQCNTSS